ncbi:MAG: aminopeptidase P family protein [Candidatus Thermoplasmatota archaeon]|nr:aminopeptidase P family protein [Candidatus Thermoplasmatota archaeon]
MHEKDLYARVKDDYPILIMNGTKTYPDPNYFYFSGAKFGGFENCAMVVNKSGTTIITMELEAEAARETDCEVLVYKTQAERSQIIIDKLKASDKVYINASKLNVQHYFEMKKMLPNTTFIDCSSEILSTRMIKTEQEIASLKEATKISSRALENAWSKVHEGMTEKEFGTSLVSSMMELGSALPQCEPTIAFGENTAFPHFQATDRRLKRGDFILADFNALYNKYTSDLTRTVVFGNASKEQNEMHDIVLQANEAGRKAIKDGAVSKDVERIARNIIDSSRFKGKFIHGLGHGIGLELHDHPALSISSDMVLKKNMTITVEPGIYVFGVGGVRIEDDVVVTKDGSITMTDTTRELVEL